MIRFLFSLQTAAAASTAKVTEEEATEKQKSAPAAAADAAAASAAHVTEEEKTEKQTLALLDELAHTALNAFWKHAATFIAASPFAWWATAVCIFV